MLAEAVVVFSGAECVDVWSGKIADGVRFVNSIVDSESREVVAIGLEESIAFPRRHLAGESFLERRETCSKRPGVGGYMGGCSPVGGSDMYGPDKL